VSKRTKKYSEMTATELAAATREFDEENVADTFRPMTPAEEADWQAAVQKRPRGRPRVGKGVKVVSLGIEADLLRRADALAKKRRISRAKLVAEGLEAVLAKGRRPIRAQDA
jgi:uncharacterized protein (DUF4415 family)